MMENVTQDVHKVHEIFSDLRDIVGEQAEAVDQVEQDVERAHSRAESGVNQLVGAAKRQKTGAYNKTRNAQLQCPCTVTPLHRL